MNYQSEGIAALVSVIDEMQTVSMILADKKVKELLKCLAYYDEFRAVLSYVNQGYDYQTEKRKALQHVGDRQVLRLPKTENSLVAFVANLLVDFDDGTMDVITFAGEYFPQATRQDSYNTFLALVIEPFKYALVNLVHNGVKEEIPMVERSVDFAPSGLYQQVEYLLVRMISTVKEGNMVGDERSEYELMLEGFASALDSRDTLMIKAMWLGLSKALAQKKLCADEIQKVNDALRLYLLTK